MFTDSELGNIGRNGAELVHEELQENFHIKKCNALLLADSYMRLGMTKKAKRVRGCGAYLEYRIDPNRLNEQGYQRLHKAYFCGDILCPICQWRKARKSTNQLAAIMAHIKEYRFIFLTLTIQNVYVDELYPAVDNMLREAWHSLINNRRFKNAVCGYYRTFEVSHDVEPVITKSMFERKRRYYNRHGLKVGDINPAHDTYHPHIHSILAVEPSYFDKKSTTYIKQKEWREIWQKALDVTYDPYVFVEIIYDKNSGEKGSQREKPTISAILEVAKYTAKSNDYLVRGADKNIDKVMTDEAVSAISSSLANRRLISYGGVFRQAHKELHLDAIEDGDLLHIEAEEKKGLSDYIEFNCVWAGKKGYVVKATTVNEHEKG